MANIWLFLGTVALYSGIYWCLQKPQSVKAALSQFGLLAALCLPVNVNGYVLTVIGNAQGEKGVYSLCSLYQESQNGDTFSLVGLAGYQKAGHHAVTGIGLAGYQEAGNDAVTCFGLSGYQEAGNDAVTGVGLSGYQEAGNVAVTGAGLSGYQEAGNKANLGVGLSGYQKAGETALACLGLALFQKVKDKERTFGAFVSLKADK